MSSNDQKDVDVVIVSSDNEKESTDAKSITLKANVATSIGSTQSNTQILTVVEKKK